ncbi:hypothetical protein BUALT_Bualt11G0077100 [Buddleja alternifolia]|uniref:Uncharacterized protein n=1 Tax=Buddleja alternifolia TaxID=168488 RepID=A0AAV6X1T9_9LAMI|nr:hypothetical protein BUALT_Bualt11G0077100 [Buddleja alternifolia]
MEDYLAMKLKRKDLEDVNDDFSDFSLSSPARKIRRLDSELPPIIEDEECDIPLVFEQSVPQEQRFGVRIEELPDLPENEERAIVIFSPPNPRLQSPSNFSVSVDPHLISGFRSKYKWTCLFGFHLHFAEL